jgi:triacylglycerol esterase/lipase EstA (alpha/beta hydrolase family)
MPIRVAAFLTFVVALVASSAASGSTGPALETPAAKLDAALHCPDVFDDAAHEPVLLVHGTFTNGEMNWGWSYVPALGSLGFDVCWVNLPNSGLDDIQIASEYVVHAVRQIAARSGEKVDMLGVSQGGIEPRWATKWWPDVQTSVDDLVMLASPNHGIYGQPIPPMRCFAACWQLAKGSKFIAALNRSDETPGAVSYTSIYSLFDVMVPAFPDRTAVVAGASNVLIQDVCPGRPVDHVLISADAVSYALALDAFTHPGPADVRRFDPATCQQIAMPGADYNGGGGPVMDEITRGGPTFTWLPAEPPLKAYAR